MRNRLAVLRLLVLFALGSLALFTQTTNTIGIGEGAPNDDTRLTFQRAFYRGIFSSLVALPPTTEVKTFGTGGYVQEFIDVTKTSGTRYALVVTPAIALGGGDFGDNFQIHHPMYSYYISSGLGPNVVGFPLGDTERYDVIGSDGVSVINKFQFQLFQRSYGLFVYNSAPETTSVSTQFTIKEPYLSKWRSVGYFAALGGVTSAETAYTSTRGTGIAGTLQSFQTGFLFNMTAGPSSGRIVTVKEPINSIYRAQGGRTGSLGYPLNDELIVTVGNETRRRQSFEGGSIEYGPNTPAYVRNGVSFVSLSTTGSIRLNLGETATVRATMSTTGGETVTDRDVSWTTSNNRVVQIQVATGSNNQVTLRAVGGGSALITATSEGRASTPLTVFVSAPCCAVGEGAPTTVISQTFLDAVQRNRLTVRTPLPNPVRRVGSGYTQELILNDGRRVLAAKSDASAQAFLIDGLLLAYEANGGASGPLGYPTGDASATGRQLFENGFALAGDPPQLVTGAILARWAQLGYDNANSTLGSPTTAASSFLTFAATQGRGQGFRNGAILVADTGLLANRAFFVRGVIAAKYLALNGPLGIAGLPTTDEFQVSGRFRQEFEGATLEYGANDTEATVTEKARRPLISATPGTVVAGNRIRIAAGGFDPGSRLRISVQGSPDFDVDTASGSFAWDVFVPATARTGAVTLRAVKLNAGATPPTATGSYSIRALTETVFDLRRIAGDTQAGAPGALLPAPLRIRLRDEFGSPVVNYPVRFSASQGATVVVPGVTGATATTNDAGEAEVLLRLPGQEGVALATAEAGRAVTTFSFRVSATSLPAFPRLMQSPGTYAAQPLGPGPATVEQKGALVASLASVLRYYQNRGEMPTPNGLADPGLVNQFLNNLCVPDTAGVRICDGFLTGFANTGDPIANPWRSSLFVGGGADLSIESTDPARIADLVAAGSPVVVALKLGAGNGATLVGAHFVVAMGIQGDGGLEIHDPNPTFGRRSLGEYLAGFTTPQGAWKAEITGAFRLVPRTPAGGSFVIATNAQPAVLSRLGSCGPVLEFPEVIAVATTAAPKADAIRFTSCDALNEPLELQFASDNAARATFSDLGPVAQRLDLSVPGGGAAYRASRTNGQWLVSAQNATFEAGSVLSAATFTPNLAPGGLFTVFGAGLARTGAATTVEVNGVAARVLFSSPYQVNAQMPVTTAPGAARLRVTSPYGQAEQTVTVSAVAPGVFLFGPRSGAVVNQNGTLNSALTPATRGQALIVYGTGFGATTLRNNLQAVNEAVTATINGVTAPVFFAGLTPGFVGLYQVNITVPATLPPGIGLPLVLTQGGLNTGAVDIAVQ